MKADINHVIRFHYRVFALPAGGEALESSFEREPLTVLLGHSGIIAGLERELIGKSSGDRFEVEIAAADAYGEVRPDFVQRVPKKFFREPAKLKPGMQTAVGTQQGPRLVTVKKVGMSVVDVDLNHPMAGKDLKFEVEVVEVREATPEELAHGHAHGPGGHQH
ncbi:FKBP-type peptidyl-prolyl cis-trans isomerase [Pseudomarimonas salicorniae]|uniref:Peptidyl-prolyl cis-trans isomerase n=1 Tax=Pseudomarimonas salicorniae TaxID=2933270 RepID=A0ABT0GHL7_9GAMM|nr:peptidylprolyl isomerase [Lysobacter sp. CAU 1642]MCK7594039.1 peptidylprolyl isomerase [Lysobacter sp. CAU 1642]